MVRQVQEYSRLESPSRTPSLASKLVTLESSVYAGFQGLPRASYRKHLFLLSSPFLILSFRILPS